MPITACFRIHCASDEKHRRHSRVSQVFAPYTFLELPTRNPCDFATLSVVCLFLVSGGVARLPLRLQAWFSLVYDPNLNHHARTRFCRELLIAPNTRQRPPFRIFSKPSHPCYILGVEYRFFVASLPPPVPPHPKLPICVQS